MESVKYKLMGGAMAALILVCALAASALEAGEGPSRVHQHLSARGPDAGCDCDGTQLCTHLPLVIIDTGGQEIPGVPNGEEDYYGEELYTTAEDGTDFINVQVTVIDNEDQNNHPSDTPDFTTASQFRIRGHASRHFEKSPYLLKFIDEDGEDNPISVMGMGAHNEWVLNGPYLDKSLIRNYLCYNLAGEIMEYAPNVRYCELIVDGDYRGLYLMVESITSGDDCRLNLRSNVKDSSITGYLLRLDRTVEEEVGSTRDIYTYMERMIFVRDDESIRYPGKNRLTEELAREIELEYSAFEKALYSYDYDTEEYGYWNYIDVDNFVDYFIINEFTRNVDSGRYSTYLYKELGEKYKLCVWDFNNAMDNFPDDEITTENFALSDRVWYDMLFRDEEFAERVIERYWELRRTVFSDEYLNRYIDETLEWLGPAIDRNTERWRESIEEWEPLTPEERNVYSQEEAVDQVRHWLHERGEWLDENIQALQARAHPSRNHAYNH